MKLSSFSILGCGTILEGYTANGDLAGDGDPVAALFFGRIKGLVRVFHDLFEREVGL